MRLPISKSSAFILLVLGFVAVFSLLVMLMQQRYRSKIVEKNAVPATTVQSPQIPTPTLSNTQVISELEVVDKDIQEMLNTLDKDVQELKQTSTNSDNETL